MKKPTYIIALIFFISINCEHDNELDVRTIDEILAGKDYAVDHGVLTFRDHTTFTHAIQDLKDKTDAELEEWESQLGFKSLRSIHANVIAQENLFLEEISRKNPNNTTLTRKEIGFTSLAHHYITEGLLSVNEYETLDVNVPAPYYSIVVNENGIFRIGNEILMPKSDVIKIIRDGDFNKLSLLKSAGESSIQDKISVLPVIAHVNEPNSISGKSKTTTISCDETSGSYRMIAYVTEQSVMAETEYPCDYIPFDYFFTLRSLKKILGTWQNHQTSQWGVTTSLTINHWKDCSTGSWTLVGNVVTINNALLNGPFNHTWNHYYVSGYNIGPCASGGNGSCPNESNPIGRISFPTRSHNFYGKNGTACYLGN